jgi:hypothetical protein
VFQIGRPIGGFAASCADSVIAADQIVVSVGPYRLVSVRPSPCSAAASTPGSASPPTRTATPLSARRQSATSLVSVCHSVGVACMTVAPLSSIMRTSARGSCTVSRGATTTPAPLISGR